MKPVQIGHLGCWKSAPGRGYRNGEGLEPGKHEGCPRNNSVSRAAAAAERHKRGPAGVCHAEDAGLIVWREAPGRSEQGSGLRGWLLAELHVEQIAQKQEWKPDVGHPGVVGRPREGSPVAAVRAQTCLHKAKPGIKRAKARERSRGLIFPEQFKRVVCSDEARGSCRRPSENPQVAEAAAAPSRGRQRRGRQRAFPPPAAPPPRRKCSSDPPRRAAPREDGAGSRGYGRWAAFRFGFGHDGHA